MGASHGAGATEGLSTNGSHWVENSKTPPSVVMFGCFFSYIFFFPNISFLSFFLGVGGREMAVPKVPNGKDQMCACCDVKGSSLRSPKLRV